MKRVTNYPQVVLGFPFASAIPVCCSALEIQPFSKQRVIPTASLFVANVISTMIYDTIYAHQDIQDDIRAKVKSMAVRFAHSTKTLATTLAIVQIGLLVVVGLTASFCCAYFVFTCGATAAILGTMLMKVDLGNPSSCGWFFHRGFWYVGGSMVTGFAAEYCTRLMV